MIAFDVRFASANPCAIHDRQSFDTVLSGIFHQRCELWGFRCGCGYDQFSGVAVRHAMCGAKFVGQNISADAMTGLQRSRRIIKSRVNHAAIARACAHADFWERFENEDVVPAGGKRASDCAADYTTADDYDVCLLHDSIIAESLSRGRNFGIGRSLGLTAGAASGAPTTATRDADAWPTP